MIGEVGEVVLYGDAGEELQPEERVVVRLGAPELRRRREEEGEEASEVAAEERVGGA